RTPAAPAAPEDAPAKLKRARALLSQFDLDGAEAKANEAAALKAAYDKGEDTPQAVLQDVARVRKDAKVLLTAARVALHRGELDKAEALGKAADKASGTFTFALSGDSPSSLLKDVTAARAQAKAAPKQPEHKPDQAPTQTAKTDKGPAADAHAQPPAAA